MSKSSDSKNLPADKGGLIRRHSLALPQLISGGLSEHWLLKEFGDVHWTMISDSLKVKTSQIKDDVGNRLNASFVRLQWSATENLHSFKENEDVDISGTLQLYGDKMFLSEQLLQTEGKSITAQLISVFSSRSGTNNDSLIEGTPAGIKEAQVQRAKKMPEFAAETIALKTRFLKRNSRSNNAIYHHFHGLDFKISEKSVFEIFYQVDAYDDINGVGLLYFATYSKISDKCELQFFQNHLLDDSSRFNWGKDTATLARDIVYLGNANAGEDLRYTLDSCQYSEVDEIWLASSLYRKKDNFLIAKIFTVKKILAEAVFGSLTDDREAARSSDQSNRTEASEDPESEVTTLKVDVPKISTALCENDFEISLRDTLQEYLTTMLEIEGIDPHTDLRPYGVESIVYLGLAEHLNEKFELDCNPSRFYGLNTINEITSLLCKVDGTSKNGVINDELNIDAKATSLEPQAELSPSRKTSSVADEIAIIGVSLRVPGADSPEAFWANLVEGHAQIGRMPDDRWQWPSWVDLKDKHKGADFGGFIQDVDCFDPLFFGISPREAELMDPQQRILLELVWELFEGAGYKPSKMRQQQAGVFVGVSGSDYDSLLSRQQTSNCLTATGTATALLANRISYFYGLEGPSLSLDTACSSSLVALDAGVRAIREGACKLAVVGGVHLMCNPYRSLAYKHSNMLSPDSCCHTFDSKANGYVRGEGAIVVLLKPLSEALHDCDQILGVVKGSAVNHGGYGGGLTVPSPKQQQKLIEAAVQTANVPISAISYIEAHGTGTSLGDPIEIAGLTEAFKSLKPQNGVINMPWCSLGSVKTNIGHLEAASGLAGLAKVILAMQHQYLPATLNFQSLNPKIELKDTPFFIQQQSTAWLPSATGKPLYAGISSFGIGGTNAHIILESFNPSKHADPVPTTGSELLFVLSAKSLEALKDCARGLLDYLREHQDVSLNSLAYSLLVSKEALEQRLAIVCSNRSMLEAALQAYSRDEELGYLHVADKRSKRPNTNTAINFPLLKPGDSDSLTDLAHLWLNGIDLKEDQLFENGKFERIKLPRYPFRKQKYWVPVHPANEESLESTVNYQTDQMNLRWETTLTGRETFLIDHVVNGAIVLPGVYYWELVRAACHHCLNTENIQLKDLTWMSPIQGASSNIHLIVTLKAELSGFSFEIKTVFNDKFTTHCQGKFKVSDVEFNNDRSIQLTSLQKQFNQIASKEDCYAYFSALGLSYGVSYQGIETLSYDSNAGLSLLRLPNVEENVRKIAFMDCAIQTCIGSLMNTRRSHLLLPFAVRDVTFYNPLPDTIWCYIQRCSVDQYSHTNYQFNLQLVDLEGKILLEIRELTLRAISPGLGDKIDSKENSEKIEFFESVWQTRAPMSSQQNLRDMIVLVADGATQLCESLRCQLEADVEPLIGESPEAIFLSMFEKVKICITERRPVLFCLLFEHENERDFAFLAGLLKTAQLESSYFLGKVISVDSLSLQYIDELTNVLNAERYAEDLEVRYINGHRQVKTSQCVQIEQSHKKEAFKENGVYLISGGGGVLAIQFAQVISRIKGTRVILAGRRALSPKKAELVNSLEGVEYQQCDFTVQEDISDLIRSVINQYSTIDGIIHNAGLVKDSLILNKTESEIKEVLSVKISGLRYLDRATHLLKLDFFTLFSSVSAVLGNIGQADYASANAYLDQFAKNRNELVRQGNRLGRTISINWPYWLNGGMQLDVANQQRLAKQWGMLPMPLDLGIRAFDSILLSGKELVTVAFGFPSDMRQALMKLNANLSIKVDKPAAESSDSRRNQIMHDLVELVAQISKIDKTLIQLDEELGDYGFDSILFTQLSNAVNESYSLDLMPTVFYNYPCIEELADHLISLGGANYEGKSSQYSNNDNPSSITNDDVLLSALPENQANETKVNELLVNKFSQKAANSQDEISTNLYHQRGVAIIGMSGRFPQSPDMPSFWNQIRDGEDLITEVPIERWDWKAIYGDPYKDKTKTKAKWGGFMTDVDKFDPLFFGISPQEAKLMDPQHRIILEEVYHALEDAGVSPERIRGSNTGIFMGVSTADYSMLISRQKECALHAQFPTGTFYSVLANRISYLLDLHGPSEPIDTACSSALVALHRAAEQIRSGRCHLALAGGVNVILSPDLTLSFSQAGMLSEDGRCKTFDESANGYVRGEGAGVIVLKSLEKAIEDGDRIYGIIRASAENHGGKANTLTSPNPKAQADLLLSAYQLGNVDPRDVSYIEAHGTGTSLGDPIEIEGLKAAFKKMYDEWGLPQPVTPHCRIGSVKTNIGHLEAAAGIAGVAKVLLSIQNKFLPGNPQLNQPSKFLKLENTPFELQKAGTPWISPRNKPLIAGISSFGFGGSNAHVIIEEYIPSKQLQAIRDQKVLIIMSAKNCERLREMAGNLRTLVRDKEISLLNVAYTLQTGRQSMDERLAFVTDSINGLITKLDAYITGERFGLITGNVRDSASKFLLDGEAGAAYMRAAYVSKEWASLAQLWVNGTEIDWMQLYNDHDKPEKISLPLYPFARERYWIDSDLHLPTAKHFNSPDAVSGHPVTKNIDEEPAVRFNGTRTKQDILAFVHHHLSEIVCIDSSSWHVNDYLSDYGISSIQINHLTHAINQKWSLQIRPLEVQQCLSALEIAEVIIQELPEPHHILDTFGEQLIGDQPFSQQEQGGNLSEDQGILQNNVSANDVAIIGLDVRAAGVKSFQNLIELLNQESFETTLYPERRWNQLPAVFKKHLNRNEFRGKFLDDLMAFDHKLFQISAREAMLMDPQQRILLESVWRAIENAGYTRTAFCKRKTSVFVAINNVDYADIVKWDPEIDTFSGRGVKRYISANRISHFFNLEGLSETVDTACSSVFVAIKKAIDVLRNGESEQAIVCGVQANLLPFIFQEQQAQGILTGGPRTLPFDTNATGYIRGEGVGTLILVNREVAEKERAFVYAWLKGAGVAHGGRSLNIVSPNSKSHKQAFLNALEDAQIGIDDILGIEAHGTGMPLGDESELKAFADVFLDLKRKLQPPCVISGAKSVFGHLEAASGIVAVIKSIAVLQQKRMFGIKGINKPNPSIDLTGFLISNQDQELVGLNSSAPCVGLHSYGIGGVSAFLLLQQNDVTSQPLVSGEINKVFVLSAQSVPVLRQYAADVFAYLSLQIGNTSFNYEHFLASYQANREEMAVRMAISAENLRELHELLSSFLAAIEVAETDADLLKEFICKRPLSIIAQNWLNKEKVDWGVKELSRFPYPSYPMNRETEFWINQPEHPSGHRSLLKSESNNTTNSSTNKFLMLDN